MSQSNLTPSEEWRRHWTLVLASMAGMSFIAIGTNTLGLFIEPLEREFGWRRTEITAGLAIYALVAVPFLPLVGALIDRWGARRLAIPGIVLTATSIAAFSFASGSTTQWLALWTLYAFAALSVRNTVWTAAVTSVFNSSRGLALGVTLTGTSLTAIIAPIVAQRLIDGYGWREAYIWLATGWGLIVLALLIPFFFDARDSKRRDRNKSRVRESVSEKMPGIDFSKAIRTPALIKIAIAALLFILVISAISVHLVPILTERGLSREHAAVFAGLTGVMAIVGRLVTGWTLDRWTSGWINAGNLALPGIACAILSLGPLNMISISVAVIVLGYASGAFMPVCAYLTGRYGGARNFGKIFGIMASTVAIGLGIGPLAASFLYDLSGNYLPLLLIAIPVTMVAGVLVFALGPYPDWNKSVEAKLV